MTHSSFTRCVSLLVLQYLLFTTHLFSEHAETYGTQEYDLPDLFHLHFRGDVVHSFRSDNDLLFSISAGGDLRMYPKPQENTWRGGMFIRDDVEKISVGSDFLLVLTQRHELQRQSVIKDLNNANGPYLLGEPELIASGVKDISAGSDHFLFVLEDGTLMGAGYDAGDGRLFSNTVRQVLQPVQLATSVQKASAGFGFSLFLKNDGSLWGMGANEYGNLGTGDLNPVYSPVKIADGVKTMQAEWDASWFINTEGVLFYMGKGFKLAPQIVAGDVVQAAIDPTLNQIVWIDISGKLIVRIMSDETGEQGWSIGQRAGSIVASRVGYIFTKTDMPLFRFSVPDLIVNEENNPFHALKSGTRFMTIEPNEITSALEYLTWDSIDHYVSTDATHGERPVFRFRNNHTGAYFYTLYLSEIEDTAAKSNFDLEGVAFYAFDYPAEGTEPVYRYFSPVTSSHYYALGEDEKNILLHSPTQLQFQYEGIAYWAYGFFQP